MISTLATLVAWVGVAWLSYRRPRLRRAVGWAGCAVCILLLTLWIGSIGHTFGYIGPDVGVYFESGGYVILGTGREISAMGWTGIGQSRWPVVWWFACPALVILTPVWMPLLAVAVPTAFLWRREQRRSKSGHCRNCGYNLTGNVTGRCPECGTPTLIPPG